MQIGSLCEGCGCNSMDLVRYSRQGPVLEYMCKNPTADACKFKIVTVRRHRSK